MNYQYTVIYEKDDVDGGWIASVPTLHCHTQGETREEVERNIEEAIMCCLEGFQGMGKTIPLENTPESKTYIKPIQIHLQTA